MPKLTKEQFAAMLNGRQYGYELTLDDIKLAFENDLVICFGESNDIFNAYGRIKSYACCSDCDFIYFIDNSVYNGSDARYPFNNYDYPSLRAFWSEDDDGWRYETDIPHATFKIFSGSELYCIGIVMDYKDIYPDQATPEAQKPEPYDEAYLNKKIELGTKSWSGIDHNAFIDMVRGRDAPINVCYKSGEPCKHECSGLCKESC